MKKAFAIISLVLISSTGYAAQDQKEVLCALQAREEASLFLANEIKANASYISVKSSELHSQSNSVITYAVVLFNNVQLAVSLNKADCSRSAIDFMSID